MSIYTGKSGRWSFLSAFAAIVFTLPTTGQNHWVDPSSGQDSLHVECSGGQAIHQLATARLYFSPVSGGGWRLVQEHGVSGREGQTDSFVVDSGPGGHYYVTTTNPIGESCASNVVYSPGSVVTGIEPGGAARSIVSDQTFDVQGRRVQVPSRSGVYWRRIKFSDGTVSIRRIVVLR